MKRSLILALIPLLFLAACQRGRGTARIGSEAPDFTVKDGDRSVTLSELRGKVVLLNFWATWCPPCVQEMPSLVQLQQRLKDKGVTVLAVSLDVDDAAYHKFITDRKIDFLTVRDDKQISNTLYGTFKFPETYVIDRRGIIRRKFIGGVDWNNPDIDQYLSGL